MPAGYVALPAAQMPQNAMLNFAPLNDAIDNWHRTAAENERIALVKKADARAERDQSRQDQQYAQSQDERLMKGLANRAMLAYREKDPQRKAQIWGSITSRHPKRDTLGAEWLDPTSGPELALAEAGMLPDPLDMQERQARMGLVEAQTASARAEAGDRARKAQFDQQILDLLNPPAGGPAPAAAPPATYQPQSYGAPSQPNLQPAAARGGMSYPQNAMLSRGSPTNGGWPASPTPNYGSQSSGPPSGSAPGRNAMLTAPQTNPGIVLAQNPAPPPSQPSQPQQRPAGPLDGLNPQQRTAFGLGLMGKGDAGKILLDAQQSNLQKPTVNQVEERTLNSATQLGRLADIKKQFDPSFLEIPKRMKMLGQSWSTKFGGKISEPQRQELARFAKFRSASVNNLNTILKELSGAAVTPQEYERIQNDAPVAGTGVFDGDDPVSFQAKLERTEQSLRAAIARMNFVKARGLNFSRDDLDMFMSLDDVPAAYERRGAEIEAEIRRRQPQIEPQALDEATSVQLKREWGI